MNGIPSIIIFVKKSRSLLYEKIIVGPAPQYDFFGQRGPIIREMLLRNSEGATTKGYPHFHNFCQKGGGVTLKVITSFIFYVK